MPQIFHRHVGLFFRLGFFGLVVAVFMSVIMWRYLTAFPYAQGQPVPQVIPFSHKHHVGDDGLDCRYCHTSVEKSAFAGIPPTETCMTCHSQLFTNQPPLAPLMESAATGKPLHWKRVNQVPDFVYFNHSIHVKKGVGCVTCHGRIDEMPLTWRSKKLTMAWCLNCHRNPEKYLRPRDRVFDLHWKAEDQRALGEYLVKEYRVHKERLTDCSVCHR